MRQLKFRVFDKKFNKFVDPCDVHINAGKGKAKGVKGGYGYVDTWEIMQFTGMRDMEGVEIYEGDILETQYEYGASFMSDDGPCSGLFRGKVHFTPSKGFILIGCIDLEDESDKWEKRGRLEIRSKSSKVIGNIYQHKELLE